jgi:hypothetical protein
VIVRVLCPADPNFDGDGLRELLKRYELGVKTTVRQVEEVAIDAEFFQDV